MNTIRKRRKKNQGRDLKFRITKSEFSTLIDSLNQRKQFLRTRYNRPWIKLLSLNVHYSSSLLKRIQQQKSAIQIQEKRKKEIPSPQAPDHKRFKRKSRQLHTFFIIVANWFLVRTGRNREIVHIRLPDCRQRRDQSGILTAGTDRRAGAVVRHVFSPFPRRLEIQLKF